MTDLTEFLLERITEDEASARQPYLHSLSGITATNPAELIGQLDDWQKHVLAECEAKRRIVEIHQGAENAKAIMTAADDGTVEAAAAIGMAASMLVITEGIMKLLAQVYADHPAYNPEWRP